MSKSAVQLYRHMQTRRVRAAVARPTVPVHDRFVTAHALGWRPRP